MSPETILKPLLGKTITSCEGANAGDDVVVFDTAEGPRYMMHHEQDCCESVRIHAVEGRVCDILNSPVLSALESNPDERPNQEYVDSFTWTVFTITTAKGSLVIRWLGESNGYYSESVSFTEQ